ncbi:MAG TPA: UPF0149 family protein [Steroidobacteraceae bacterium]|nr:UPF0149 family protein [Steroidobacteraceae bacterium]
MHAAYAEIQRALDEAHSLADAAEAHGTLAGCLCAAVSYRFEDWLQEILPEGEAAPAGARTLQQLFTATSTALSEPQMEFMPLLPEEAAPIGTRAEALGAWTRGFLYGLGSGALVDARALEGDLGEVVRDFTELTRVGVDEGESAESNEGAYAELVEFVRAGVQLLFEELAPLRHKPPAQEPLH